MKFIIKAFSEIIVKSRPVRKRYMDFLQTNASLSLKKIDSSIKVRNLWDRMEVEIEDKIYAENSEKIIKSLSRIPWIENFIEVSEYAFISVEELLKNTWDLYWEKISWKSFVVRVKRSWKHDFSSVELERYIWGGLLKSFPESRVDLHKPDYTVNIEIKDDKAFLVKNKYFWIWGYPVWTQDKVISLISWWFDSSVSTYSMIKRWCKLDYLFFNLWWKDHELWVKQTANYIWNTFSSGYKARFITIDFEEVIEYIVKNVNHRFRGIILKRLFLMVADRLAKENEYYAIIKWDSLWQVSSQTLKNMFVIDKASDTLVLRPLISFNKQEIINLSIQIWTYEFACSMPEYCAVISDKPATWAKLEQVLEEEIKIPLEIIEKSIANKKVEFIDKLLEMESENGLDIDVSYLVWENEVVIDIREEPMEQANPLKLKNLKVLKIPFFDITYDFKNLDQTKTYLLYCDKWVMSKNYAVKLKENGFNNVKIFRWLSYNSCELSLDS